MTIAISGEVLWTDIPLTMSRRGKHRYRESPAPLRRGPRTQNELEARLQQHDPKRKGRSRYRTTDNILLPIKRSDPPGPANPRYRQPQAAHRSTPSTTYLRCRISD